jgi:uncharacterized protein YciI
MSTAPNLQFVPPAIMQHMHLMRSYVLLLLWKGSQYECNDTQRIIQAEHLPYIFKLREQGKMLLSCPVMDQTDIAAIGLYAVTDKEEAQRLAEADPAVQQGVFSYELLHCMGMQGDTLQ